MNFSSLKTVPVFFLLILLTACATQTYVLRQPEPVNPQDGFPASYTDQFTGMEFILVPSGSFTMGSPDNEKGRGDDEGPAHTVILDSFYMGKYEVTQAQWQQVRGSNPSHFKGHPGLPVENVSWNDVQVFIKRLNKKTGRKFRMPTEAEWEYSCRAGSVAPFCCGSDNRTLIEYAWFDMNSGGETHVAGTRLPNNWGMYDMHGNVNEWVGDGRRGYLSRTVRNPHGISSIKKALFRGGSWLYPAYLCRSANRMAGEKDFRSHIIGFRLAIDKASLIK